MALTTSRQMRFTYEMDWNVHSIFNLVRCFSLHEIINPFLAQHRGSQETISPFRLLSHSFKYWKRRPWDPFQWAFNSMKSA